MMQPRCPTSHSTPPVAAGGETTAGNLQLRFRAHDAYEAEQWFGPLILRKRQPAYESGHRKSATADRQW